jgi:succinyl-CoA synthetase beta subunit
MILTEHAGKVKLHQKGVPVPRGEKASSPYEVSQIARGLAVPVAIKAQVPAGKRGKAGGIRFAYTPEAAQRASMELLGSSVLGHPVWSVLVEEKLDVCREMYVSFMLDVASGGHMALFSPLGGVDVEELAISHPESIHRVSIDPLGGFQASRALLQSEAEGVENGVARFVEKLYEAYTGLDCTLLEINPLALLADGRVVALDCKMEVDDNALYRHPDLRDMKRESMDDRERCAADLGVTYVGLDGDVAVIGSGAGLGMATMDIVKLAGMEPANFLDTGGGITSDLMYGAVRLVLEPRKVRGGLINLYGGINPMVAAADGIVAALQADQALRKPLVVKVLGNQQEEAWKLLEGAGIPVVKTVRTEDAAERLARLMEGSAR